MMGKNRKYRFNAETLAYEIHHISTKSRWIKGCVLFAMSMLLSWGYYYIYTDYLNLKTPKTLILEKENEALMSKMELLNRKVGDINKTLTSLQMRDNNVYRPIFGMDEIPQDVRDAGFGGVERYEHLNRFEHSEILRRTAYNMDVLYKKSFVQSKSFDDIFILAKNADEMSACIPAIPPVDLTIDAMRFASSFGYRTDPVFGDVRMHQGIDLACPVRDPINIYATGKGVVSDVRFEYGGYGHYVIIDHGFGYKTRYAHLEKVLVKEGTAVSRGDVVGLMGNTGKSVGKHLHYEVIYRNRHENPVNYYNSDITKEEFSAMVTSAD